MSRPSTNPQLLQLGTTNVSSPSIIHRSESAQSITASESYYSLSDESGRTIPAGQSTHTIQRFQTPPSRYRTPLQSRDNLAERQSPLHGQGQRRSSMDNETAKRDSMLRRKPVPSTVMEGSETGGISPMKARSSAALDIMRQDSTTPDIDDKPFIQFAIDQLTRDEEVRGSRAYFGPRDDYDQTVMRATSPQATLGAERDILPVPMPAAVPPRNPNRPLSSGVVAQPIAPMQQVEAKIAQKESPDVFLPLAADRTRPLRFKPAILRPFAITLFLLVVAAYLALLLLAAIYSLRFTGMWTYGTIGDSRYFVFRYLPALLGMVLLLWVFQIQIAITRMAPFLAMSSFAPKNRLSGVDLPIYLSDFLLPKLRYFRARLPYIGVFMLVAWLQLFTIPLLSACFNVYYVGENWRWTAVQGVVWATVGLYILLIIATILLVIDLARYEETGLRWDPRSLADIMVMLERSNALDSALRNDPARLGYWRTSNRPNDAFLAFGRANLEPRRYSVEAGRLREKPRESTDTQWRHSKDAILGGFKEQSIAYPWYLRLSAVLLWITIAVVLVLAFLIVSYLPSTGLSRGFLPALPVIVDSLGFGADNFLYSFIATIIAMLCLLFWIDLDFTHRRYAPVIALLKPEGSLAEHSLLLSYSADYPFIVTLSAMANGHWRLAWITFNTLIAAALPVLAAGVFWAQFDVPTQQVRIYAHSSGFYALTVLVTIYALSYFFLLPLSRTERRLARRGNNQCRSFADIIALVRNSRMLDDFAFHGPVSKVDLVTRLLSVQPGARVEPLRTKISTIPEAGTSMLSLADSVRGFGNARSRAVGGANTLAVPRYGLARWGGRDGNEFWGIDRFR